MNIFKAINMGIKYRAILPLAIKFIEEIIDSVGDRKITKAERSRMMKSLWSVVLEIQRIQKAKVKA